MAWNECGVAPLHNGMELYLNEMCYTMMTELSAEDFARLRLEWLWVYEAEVPHYGKWSQEIMVPDGVFFVLSGEARLRFGGKTIVVQARQVFFGGQGVRRQWFAEGTRLLSVGFRASWLQHGPLIRQGLNCVLEPEAVSLLHKATIRLLNRIHPARKTIAFKEASEAGAMSLERWLGREMAFREWFSCYMDTLESVAVPLDQPTTFGDPRLAAVLKSLDDWPLTRKLAVAELIASAGCTYGRRRLEQLMQQHTGMSLFDYLERRRLAVACDELVCGKRAVKELAFDLGFQYASHFTKWFQRLAGLTPSAYRISTKNAV